MTDQRDRFPALELAAGEEKHYPADENLYTIQLATGEIEIRHGNEAIGPATMTLPAPREGSTLKESAFSVTSPFTIIAKQPSTVRVFAIEGHIDDSKADQHPNRSLNP